MGGKGFWQGVDVERTDALPVRQVRFVSWCRYLQVVMERGC